MAKTFSGCVMAATVLIPLVAPALGQVGDESDSLFDMTSMVDVHLYFTPEEWKKLQPPEGVNWDFGKALDGVRRDAAAGRNFHSKKSSRPGVAGYIGVDHQYGMADVSFGDEMITDLGVRFKGNGTFFAGHANEKYSFKIDFNEYRKGFDFRGLRKVNLNNNATDPSMLREALSYELFREAGVPASRTGWAKVYLTITGEADRKYVGIYLIVEQVDKRFLKRVYGASDGLLLKPSTFGTFRYFGDDWNKYEAAYFPKTEPSPEQKQRLIDFARLLHKGNDAEFKAQITDYLDMDEFLSFLAVNVILSNLDSFLGGSQNYYAYLEPATNKFQLLPWDLDISFGAFSMLGTPESRRDLSIDRPQVGKGSNRLIERVLAIPEHRQAYRDRIEQLTDSMFDEEKMRLQIDEAAEFLRPHIAELGDKELRQFEAHIAETPEWHSPHAMKYFVSERRKSIANQLAGRSTGEHHAWNKGPGAEAVFKWLAFGVAFFVVSLINCAAWISGAIAGFRDSNRWGILNLLFYPLAPLVFGFGLRKARVAASFVVLSISMMIALVAVMFSLA